jgi:xanthine dehydrogenase accessory factor
MESLFEKLTDCVQSGRKVALATVISRKGSLPMSKQAKMLVFSDGSIMGTIGGGSLEARVIREAQYVLNNERAKIVAIELTADQIEAEGLTCGGIVSILIEYFAPQIDLTMLHALTKLYTGSQSAVVATLFHEGVARKMIIPADGTQIGTIGDEAANAQIGQIARARIGKEYHETVSLDVSAETARELGIFPDTQLRVFLESVLPVPTAYLFGGGHIAFHLSKILPLIGFDFVVIDDRQAFANADRFPEAKVCLVHEFAQVFDVVSFHPDASYVIIVTRGHQSDLSVLEQALRTDVKYIGMIGSRRKIHLLFQRLREQGVSQAVLDKVHAPIGLEIGADTPEEIAVSIAAELIKVRRLT